MLASWPRGNSAWSRSGWRSVKASGLCGGVVLLIFLGAWPACADTLVITNITTRPGFTPRSPVTLSDLVVYGTDEFGDPTSMVILKPKDASDDVMLKGGAKVTYDVPFTITKYDISETYKGKEYRSVYLHLRSSTRTTAMLSDNATGDALVLADDENLYTDPPAAGTSVSFVDGLNPSFPDWFLGTSFDETTGDISGAFTGTATVDLTDFEVDIVPEPASLTLLAGFGLIALLAFRRRKTRVATATE